MKKLKSTDGLASDCEEVIYVTVCKNVILSNLKHGRNDPAVRVSRGKYGKPRRYRKYRIGNVLVTCDMKRPLPWGARVWVEITERRSR